MDRYGRTRARERTAEFPGWWLAEKGKRLLRNQMTTLRCCVLVAACWRDKKIIPAKIALCVQLPTRRG
jgi:hypothetical protein